jgi:hypothetical protein
MTIKRPLKDLLETQLGERELAGAWDRVRQRREGRRGARWLAGASLAVVALALWLGRAPAPLRLANHDTIGIMEAPRQLRTLQMSDGSHVLLSPGTRLDTVANEGGVFGTTLIRGRAEFEVRPGGHHRWLVHAGDVTVEVTGTHFVVKRMAGAVWVHVTRGQVIVRGERVAGGARRLDAGESLSVAIPPPPPPLESVEPIASEPFDDAPEPMLPDDLPPAPYQIDVQRISGADPHLPDAVREHMRGHGDKSFVARICVDREGAVSDVAVLQGIAGADEALQATLRQWRYEPQPIPLCFVTQLIFSVQ